MQTLVDLLNKEIKAYEQYLELATRKKQSLIDNDFDQMEAVTIQEKVISTKILHLESERHELLRDEGFNPQITVTELIDKVPEEYRDVIKQTSEELKEVLVQCKKFNDRNMVLLRQSSTYINHMIKTFSQHMGGSPATYGKGMNKFESAKIADMQG